MNHPVDLSVDHSVEHPHNYLADHSVNRSVNHSVNHSINLSVRHSVDLYICSDLLYTLHSVRYASRRAHRDAIVVPETRLRESTNGSNLSARPEASLCFNQNTSLLYGSEHHFCVTEHLTLSRPLKRTLSRPLRHAFSTLLNQQLNQLFIRR